MPWYTYILLCNDKSYYIGITNDLKKRLILYNTGKGSKYLLSKLPVKLFYYEEYPDKSEARLRPAKEKFNLKVGKE